MKNQELEKGILELAQKRMFTMKIVDSDTFLSMSAGAQCVYFHLCMRSDNDGFLKNWKRIFQIINITEKDIFELIENGYLKKTTNGIYKLPLFKETTGYGERERERHTKEYREWRKKVLERDKYICQMCERPKSNIAHHKIRFRDCYDNENIAHDVNNGICLCKRCHKMVHGGGNYING